MAIVVNLDLLLVKRKMKLTELASRVEITLANMSVLKQNKARAIRFSTLDAMCRELGCQPGDLLEYVPDPPPAQIPGQIRRSAGLTPTPARRLVMASDPNPSACRRHQPWGVLPWMTFRERCSGFAIGFWCGSSPRPLSARRRPCTCSTAWAADSALRGALGGVSAGTTVLAGAGASLLLLLLAATLFNALLRLEGWARIVVLVIGWITVCSAALTFLTLPGAMELYGPVLELAGPGWPALAAVSVLTKAADLAFWGWAIYVLQVNPAVRRAFVDRGQCPAGPSPTWQAKP